MVPRKPDKRIEEAKALYDKGLKLIEISDELGVPEGTVRSWKKRHGWDATLQNSNRNVAKQKGAQPGNKNATGPPGNKHAVKHGLFEKYLPPETMDIVNNMTLDPLDILWDQIQIAYAAIVRAQRIMYVNDIDDQTKEITMDGAEATAYDIQQAWDKQANFLKAQARAQAELRSLIKQHDDLAKSGQASEEQLQRVNLLKAQVEKMQANDDQVKAESQIQKLFDLAGVELDNES